MFLDYRHNSSEATDVTFNLKDFKAVLVLCEGLGTNVALCFDQPGSPLLVHPVFHSSNPLVRHFSRRDSAIATVDGQTLRCRDAAAKGAIHQDNVVNDKEHLLLPQGSANTRVYHCGHEVLAYLQWQQHLSEVLH